MVAMGRALMARPRLLLLDEPSLGLAPLIADEIFDIIHQLSRAGVTILLVEQNAARALTASRSAYLLANGRIVGQGQSEALLVDPELRRAFLGAASENNPAGIAPGRGRTHQYQTGEAEYEPADLYAAFQNRGRTCGPPAQGPQVDGAPRLRRLQLLPGPAGRGRHQPRRHPLPGRLAKLP